MNRLEQNKKEVTKKGGLTGSKLGKDAKKAEGSMPKAES